ncbi:MAG: S24/S26 family peptidase [Pseudomonadota bacterium]
MRPFLPDGTPVMIRPLPRRLPRVGEIVLVPRGDDVALHRVLRVSEGFVTTRGDGCTSEDPPVPVSDVRGVAVHAIRRGRSLPLDGPALRALGWVLAKLMPVLWKVKTTLLQG